MFWCDCNNLEENDRFCTWCCELPGGKGQQLVLGSRASFIGLFDFVSFGTDSRPQSLDQFPKTVINTLDFVDAKNTDLQNALILERSIINRITNIPPDTKRSALQKIDRLLNLEKEFLATQSSLPSKPSKRGISKVDTVDEVGIDIMADIGINSDRESNLQESNQANLLKKAEKEFLDLRSIFSSEN